MVSLYLRKKSPKIPMVEHPFLSHFCDDVITGNSKHRHFQTFSNIFPKNGSNVLEFGQKTYFMMVFKIKIKNFEKNIFRGFGWTKMAENSRFWPFFLILGAFLQFSSSKKYFKSRQTLGWHQYKLSRPLNLNYFGTF